MLHHTQKTSKASKMPKEAKISKKAVLFVDKKGRAFVPSEDRTHWIEVIKEDLPKITPIKKEQRTDNQHQSFA
jgi:hypothetical protein